MNIGTTQKKGMKALVKAGAAVAGISLIAGCSGGSPASGSSAAPEAAGAELAGETLGVALNFLGAEEGAADSSLPPVKIGFVNVEGGIPSFPEASAAADATAQLINEHLGGVDGHPLELVHCNIVESEEDGLRCGQQFANDDSIMSVQFGMTAFGTGPIFNTIGSSKNIIGMGAFAPEDLVGEGALFYGAAAYAGGPAVARYTSEYLNAETAALVYDGSDPGNTNNARLIVEQGAALGVEINAVPAANTSEISSALISSGAQNADVLIVDGPTSVCAPAAQAIESLGITTPVVNTGFCSDQSVADALGDFPEWTFMYPHASNMDPGPDGELFRATMAEYAPDAKLSGPPAPTFGVLLAQVKAMNEIGFDSLTTEAVNEWLRDFKGPVLMGPPELDCGFIEKAPTLCSTYAVFMEYEGDGVWADPTDGKGVDNGDLAGVIG